MKTLDAAVLAQAQADSLAPVLLLEFPAWGGVQRWHSENTDLSWDGHTWDGRPFGVSAPAQAGGAGGAWSIRVADADLYVTKLVLGNNPQGDPVTLFRLYLDPATAAPIGAETLAAGLVGALRFDQAEIGIDVIGTGRSLARRVPGLTYDRACSRTYATPDTDPNTCQHADTCGHTWADCVGLSYTDNYGGVPMLAERNF